MTLVVVLLATICNTNESVAGNPINVLLFMPDDMQFLWDERPTNPGNQQQQHTELVPHMNRIRAEGVVFTEA